MSSAKGNGIPVLVGPKGIAAQTLERVPLTQEGRSEFDEAWLQRLVHENPICLPITEIEPGLDEFVAICREVPTPCGYIDNLLMTGKGDIAFVETKLFRNPEARRQVLAQALDYATSLFEMSYEKFEEVALKGIFEPHSKPKSLYEAFAQNECTLSEAAFVDAVTEHLRKGQVLILIAGDGIRGESEKLLEGLQMHARFGFVMALIELGVFRMPGSSDQFLIRPRTLAKTSIVQRTIVEIKGAGAVNVHDKEITVPETLSAENYWRALESKVPGARAALEKLLQKVEPLGVYPDFLKSLVLRWDRPGFKPVNLGYITNFGTIWTDLCPRTPEHDISLGYVREIATAFACDVYTLPKAGTSSPYKNGGPLRLASIMDRLDAWIEPMRRFIDSLHRYDEGAG